MHGRCADGLGGRTVYSETQVSPGQDYHRPLPGPRGTVGCRPAVDRQGNRRCATGSLFSASERWRADDAEHEHYSDSGGKSGGQREKLAYTILAASLAYQFGLEWGAVRSAVVPLRCHRRGFRARVRRVGAVWAAPCSASSTCNC